MKSSIFTVLSIIILLPFFGCKSEGKSSQEDSKSQSGIEEEHESGNLIPSKLEKDYFTVDDSKFIDGNLPDSKCDVELEGVEVSSQVMKGAYNFITITTDQNVSRFFLAVVGEDGYIEYIPVKANPFDPGYPASDGSGNMRKDGTCPSGANYSATDDDYMHSYIIPLLISENFPGECTLILEAELDNGCITNPVYIHLKEIQTRQGTLEVKLSFNNEKDVDLHLITPSGRHIYYQTSRNGIYFGENSNLPFGLDIDSNAGCNIDGINKENIYIPEEFIEPGVYHVGVDMFENCNPSLPTTYSVVVRYKGEPVRPLSGRNPAYGTFPAGYPSSRHTNIIEIMSFRIR